MLDEHRWFHDISPARLAAHVASQVDPQRFHDLAMRWLERGRRLLDEAPDSVLRQYERWLRGEGTHPRDAGVPSDGFEWRFYPLERYVNFWDNPSSRTEAVYELVFENNTLKASAHAAEAAYQADTKEHVEQGKGRIDAEEYLAVFCSEFRDIAGNPFRRVVWQPEWNSETAVALARGIEAELAFDRMPILADALEEAGCDSQQVLQHCRNESVHVRGCWVVDSVLGREL